MDIDKNPILTSLLHTTMEFLRAGQ